MYFSQFFIVAYETKLRQNDEAYDQLYVCGKCQEGCETCHDDSPCLASYNWTFRYVQVCLLSSVQVKENLSCVHLKI